MHLIPNPYSLSLTLSPKEINGQTSVECTWVQQTIKIIPGQLPDGLHEPSRYTQLHTVGVDGECQAQELSVFFYLLTSKWKHIICHCNWNDALCCLYFCLEK